MKIKPLLILLLLGLFLIGCQKKTESPALDLTSDDEATRRAAIEALIKNPPDNLAEFTAKLMSDNLKERKAVFEVMRRLGSRTQPVMLDKIGAVWKDNDNRLGFIDYFRSLGAPGYQALLEKFLELANLIGEEHAKQGSVFALAEINHQFESISLIIEGLENQNDVGAIPKLLKSPANAVRVRAAYVLCIKNWKPIDRTDQVIFYTHLMTTLQCPAVPKPGEEAARIAAADMNFFLSSEDQYPAGAGVRAEILVQSGTEEAAKKIYDQATKTDTEFLLLSYFNQLKKMENEAGRRYAKKLLSDPKTGKSLRVLDPDAAKNL